MKNLKLVLYGLIWVFIGVCIDIGLLVIGNMEFGNGSNVWIFYVSYMVVHITNKLFSFVRSVKLE